MTCLPLREMIIAAVAAPLLAGCATYRDGPVALAGTEWALDSLDGMAVSDSTATIGFESSRLSASAGCNQMGADFRTEGGRLITGPVAATRMYCEGKMDAEQRLGALLEADPSYAVSGDTLTLGSAAHRATMRRAR